MSEMTAGNTIEGLAEFQVCRQAKLINNNLF